MPFQKGNMQQWQIAIDQTCEFTSTTIWPQPSLWQSSIKLLCPKILEHFCCPFYSKIRNGNWNWKQLLHQPVLSCRIPWPKSFPPWQEPRHGKKTEARRLSRWVKTTRYRYEPYSKWQPINSSFFNSCLLARTVCLNFRFKILLFFIHVDIAKRA